LLSGFDISLRFQDIPDNAPFYIKRFKQLGDKSFHIDPFEATFTSEFFPEIIEETSLPECPCSWKTGTLPLVGEGLSGFKIDVIKCTKNATMTLAYRDPRTGQLLMEFKPSDSAEIIMVAKRSCEPPLQTSRRKLA
jgi:hypothetical protein